MAAVLVAAVAPSFLAVSPLFSFWPSALVCPADVLSFYSFFDFDPKAEALRPPTPPIPPIKLCLCFDNWAIIWFYIS